MQSSSWQRVGLNSSSWLWTNIMPAKVKLKSLTFPSDKWFDSTLTSYESPKILQSFCNAGSLWQKSAGLNSKAQHIRILSKYKASNADTNT